MHQLHAQVPFNIGMNGKPYPAMEYNLHYIGDLCIQFFGIVWIAPGWGIKSLVDQ